MRPVLSTAFLALMLLAGCITTQADAVRIYTRWDTPQLSFATFRQALLGAAPDVVHESLSPQFKEAYGVPGLGQFKIGYELYRGEFDELGKLLARSTVQEITYQTAGERLIASVILSDGKAGGEFILIDLPTWEVTVQIDGYEAERIPYYLEGSDFSHVLGVRDGNIYLGPLNASETGVLDPSEILRLSLQHRWLLLDIKKLVNVRPLLERLRSAGGTSG